MRLGFADPWGKPFKTLWSRRFLTGSIYRSAGLDPRAPHECEVLFAPGATLVGDASPTRDLAVLRPLVLEREPAPTNASPCRSPTNGSGSASLSSRSSSCFAASPRSAHRGS